MRAQSWATLILIATTLVACGPGRRFETRTFELRYLDAEMAHEIIYPYTFHEESRVSRVGNVLTVRETVDNLDQIARVLAEYDRPKPHVRLSFQIIRANGADRPDPRIAEVETALRKLFRFSGYELVAEALIAGIAGSELSQAVAGKGGPYHIRAEIGDVRAAGDSGSVEIAVGLFVPDASQLQTTVYLRAGQTAVLGNVQADPTGGTLILTVRPELVPS